MASDMDLREMKDEIAKLQEMPLITLEGSNEMYMLWLRTCAYVPLLQLMDNANEGEQKAVEAQSSLQSEVTAVQSCSA